MVEMLGKCGFRCDLCTARSKDPAVRQKLVDTWRTYAPFLAFFTAETVACDGCLSDGKRPDKDCSVRPCAMNKRVETCGHCDEFPCEKVKPRLFRREDLTRSYRDSHPGEDVPDDAYDLSLRPFETLPRLDRIRQALGKSAKEPARPSTAG